MSKTKPHVDQLLRELTECYYVWGHRTTPYSFHCELQEPDTKEFIWFYIKWNKQPIEVVVKRENPGNTESLVQLIWAYIPS